jgi:hypothetical protein
MNGNTHFSGTIYCGEGQKARTIGYFPVYWIINITEAQDWILFESCGSYSTYSMDVMFYLDEWNGVTWYASQYRYDNDGICPAANDHFSAAILKRSVPANTIFVLYVDEYNYNPGNYFLNVRCSSLNDSYPLICVLSCLLSSVLPT